MDKQVSVDEQVEATPAGGAPRRGAFVYVGVQSWAGLNWSKVEILKVTPKRYRVRWIEAGVGHPIGSESYVPHGAIRRGALER